MPDRDDGSLGQREPLRWWAPTAGLVRALGVVLGYPAVQHGLQRRDPRAPGFSLQASLSALAGFLIGAAIAGRLIDRVTRRTILFALGTAAETVLLAAATLIVVVRRDDLGGGWSNLIAGLAALALGLQNGVVRRLAVPDLTTTVLTMTLTGIAADLRSGTVVVRRILAVVAMLIGAVAGTLLVLHQGPAVALGCVLALSAAVTGAALLAWRREALVG